MSGVIPGTLLSASRVPVVAAAMSAGRCASGKFVAAEMSRIFEVKTSLNLVPLTAV